MLSRYGSIIGGSYKWLGIILKLNWRMSASRVLGIPLCENCQDTKRNATIKKW